MEKQKFLRNFPKNFIKSQENMSKEDSFPMTKYF